MYIYRFLQKTLNKGHESNDAESTNNQLTNNQLTNNKSEYDATTLEYSFLENKDYDVKRVIMGRSKQGREILAYECIQEPTLPTFMIVGNIHGNETMGYYIMQEFINENSFVPGTNLIIIPSINPDGFMNNTRTTSTNIDLNRDFHSDSALDLATETSVFKKYIGNLKYDVRMSLVYHGGALCVSYPLDSHNQKLNEYSASEYDSMYREISVLYTQHHTEMTPAYTENGGYINGADWYHIENSLQDYLHEHSIPNITVEISKIKNPLFYAMQGKNQTLSQIESPEAQAIIQIYWEQNKIALLKSIEWIKSST